MAKSKILVLHPNTENLNGIIAKANAQHTKNGPFEAVVLLGNEIPSTPPTTKPEVPTYFCGKTDQPGAIVDIESNFICVQDPWAVVKLQSGITIGFTQGTVESSAEVKVDVLISFQWAYSVARTQQLTLVGNKGVDDIVRATEPRYHFAVGTQKGRFYEHPVFSWNQKRSSRFISLGQEGTGGKWFYAFGITAGDDEPSIGKNPFIETEDEKENEDVAKEDKPVTGLKRRHDDVVEVSKKARVVSPDQCFFCLLNPNIESHMIVAIGTHSYLTIAKGPLSRPNRSLEFSGHAIIIPIDHEPTLPSPLESSPQYLEVVQFQESLARSFLEADHAVVFYEISRPENVHFHVQMVPVPLVDAQQQFERSLGEKTRLNNENCDKNHPLEFKQYASTDPELHKVTSTKNYLRFSVYTGKEPMHFISPLTSQKPLDLQFPRRVMAFHLRCPKRTYWERCRQTMAQESSECEKFKKFFKKNDFTQK